MLSARRRSVFCRSPAIAATETCAPRPKYRSFAGFVIVKRLTEGSAIVDTSGVVMIERHKQVDDAP